MCVREWGEELEIKDVGENLHVLCVRDINGSILVKV